MHTKKRDTAYRTIHERILESFPPPSFLNITATGVDISDSSVKVMQLKQTEEGYLPDFFEERKMAAGIVHGGDIENQESLVTVLVALRKKYDITFIRASLPEEKAYLFQTTVPYIEDKEQLRTSIEFQLEEHVPISPSESIFDYDIIRARPQGIEVSVTVFPKAVIESYQEAFVRAGMTPVSFELEGQAIANAVVPRGDTKTYMIVDFGRTRSGISIVKNGIVSFTSTIDIGGNKLTEAIMKHFNVDEFEAENIKNKKGIIDTSDENKALHESLMEMLSALKDEVNRHFLYWNNREDEREQMDKIEGIILCGGNASFAGLPEFLTLHIKVPTIRADVWQNAFTYDEYIPSMSREISLSYATAIGLALV